MQLTSALPGCCILADAPPTATPAYYLLTLLTASLPTAYYDHHTEVYYLQLITFDWLLFLECANAKHTCQYPPQISEPYTQWR